MSWLSTPARPIPVRRPCARNCERHLERRYSFFSSNSESKIIVVASERRARGNKGRIVPV